MSTACSLGKVNYGPRVEGAGMRAANAPVDLNLAPGCTATCCRSRTGTLTVPYLMACERAQQASAREWRGWHMSRSWNALAVRWQQPDGQQDEMLQIERDVVLMESIRMMLRWDGVAD